MRLVVDLEGTTPRLRVEGAEEITLSAALIKDLFHPAHPSPILRTDFFKGRGERETVRQLVA